MTPSSNGQPTPTFDPAAWQNEAERLISALPENARGRVSNALGLALNDSLRDNQPAQTIHWAREARGALPPVNWLVNGLIAAGNVILLAGDGGTGKTYAVIDLAVRLAMGAGDWLGFALSQCTVLMVDEESGHTRFMHRLRQVMDTHKAADDIPIASINMEGIQLLEKSGQARLEAVIQETKADLVILDAWIDMIAGANDDKASEVQPAYHFLRTLTERHGCAFLIIDHTNKSGGYRGSGAKKGAVDLMLIVERRGNVLTLKTEKARDIEPITLSARMSFTPDAFHLSPVNSSEKLPRFGKGEDHILHYFTKHIGSAELSSIAADTAPVSEKTVKNAARTLTDKGYIERIDTGGRGDAAVYGLTLQGKAFIDKYPDFPKVSRRDS